MNRDDRARVAAETDQVVAERGYTTHRWIDLGPALDAARAGTHVHLPGDPTLVSAPIPADRAGQIEVTHETSLDAAARLTAAAGDLVACLNFASAKHPGGGYRSGAQAQEECLARASGLVTCLEEAEDYYAFHRGQRDTAYSDRIVCSPAVPVFRSEDGRLLDVPYPVTFLTAAAPNAGAMADQGSTADLRALLASRARCVLLAAVAHGHRRVVLGAWGCGVFRNDPTMVADVFAELLAGPFRNAFDLATFAVFDTLPGEPVFQAFRDRLAP